MNKSTGLQGAISSLGGLGGIQGTLGNSISLGGSTGASYGTSANYGYTNGGAVSNAYSNSVGENWSQSNSSEDSYSRTFGREASAQEVMNAYTANLQQQEFIDQQMAYNAYEAEKNRQYQTYMSNTAYQRAVRDLLAAGLNPILAAGNMGASTPVGSQASSGLASSAKANAHAESYSESHGRSSSSSYGYNKSESRESSRSWNNSENWGSSYNESNNRSWDYSMAKTTNNIASVAEKAVGAMSNVFTGGSAGKIATGTYRGSQAYADDYNNAMRRGYKTGSIHKSSSGRAHGGRSGRV